VLFLAAVMVQKFHSAEASDAMRKMDDKIALFELQKGINGLGCTDTRATPH